MLCMAVLSLWEALSTPQQGVPDEDEQANTIDICKRRQGRYVLMFGGVLNKLFSKGAAKCGGDVVARLATMVMTLPAGGGALNMRNEADIAVKAAASRLPGK